MNLGPGESIVISATPAATFGVWGPVGLHMWSLRDLAPAASIYSDQPARRRHQRHIEPHRKSGPAQQGSGCHGANGVVYRLRCSLLGWRRVGYRATRSRLEATSWRDWRCDHPPAATSSLALAPVNQRPGL